MTIWGKLAGAAAGLAVGGPLGALLGGFAGHFVIDRELEDKELVFTIALIALSAKMAKADGVVSPSEIRAFEEILHVPEAELQNVGRVYRVAQQDVAGFDAYAQQVARIFRDKPAVLEDVLDALFHIAKADNRIHPAELDFLQKVADIFGFSEFEFARIKASHLGDDGGDPFLVLGITPDISDKDLRTAYMRLVRENHPDGLVARGVPEEFMQIAQEKLKAINGAYETIKSQRGL
ncbi:MAG: DnaJ like chaperone protein [Parvibaculaceae bacterium]|jgi:DnaJ like chaperone protein